MGCPTPDPSRTGKTANRLGVPGREVGLRGLGDGGDGVPAGPVEAGAVSCASRLPDRVEHLSRALSPQRGEI